MDARRKNFSKEEKENIVSLILKYKNIIENKKTDSITIGEKEKCWKAITEEYNSSSSYQRATVQLKAFYKNSKSDLKKKIAANRASIFRTGGGVQESVLDENDPLLSVVSSQTLTVENPFDSSHELFQIERVDQTSEETNEEVNCNLFVYHS